MSTHPAVLASQNSAQHAMAGDKEAWLSLFAEDAFLQDPVGPSLIMRIWTCHRI